MLGTGKIILTVTLRAAGLLDPQNMVYRCPTRSTQESVTKRRPAGNDVSSTALHNQSTVGPLLAGPGSTGGTLRLCTAGIARVHRVDCQKSYPLVGTTFYILPECLATYLLRPCISMVLSSVSVSPTQTGAVSRADILLSKRSQSQPKATFSVWGKRGSGT